VNLCLATNNQGKVKEYKALLAIAGLCFFMPFEVGLTQDAEESGQTFSENALIKAREICQKSGMVALADDSGLCVEALDNAPGIYSARYGDQDCKTDEERCELLLKNMRSKQNRQAYFVCAIAVVTPDGGEKVFEGRLYGQIACKPKGQNGFGYDPIFYVPYLAKHVAELNLEQKDAISHRAIASKKALPYLQGLVKKYSK